MEKKELKLGRVNMVIILGIFFSGFLLPLSADGLSLQADFTATAKVDNPLVINFSDLSSGDIVKWRWDFGDGSLPFIVLYEQKPGGKLVNTSIELSTTYPTVSGNVIVCRTNEQLAGQDLNNNGIIYDPILQYYDIFTKTLVNTMAIDSNPLPVISGDTIAFVSNEFDIKIDLNGDGKLNHNIVMYYDIRGNKVVSTGAETDYFSCKDPSIS